MRADVPLVVVGTSDAVTTYNGVLVTALETLHVEALPLDMPTHIEVDITSLVELEQSLHVRDLPIPANVTVLTDPDVMVVKISSPRVAEEGEEAARARKPGDRGWRRGGRRWRRRGVRVRRQLAVRRAEPRGIVTLGSACTVSECGTVRALQIGGLFSLFSQESAHEVALAAQELGAADLSAAGALQAPDGEGAAPVCTEKVSCGSPASGGRGEGGARCRAVDRFDVQRPGVVDAQLLAAPAS